jgi:TIR domain
MSTRRRIFLAHAREDKGQVRELYADLKARGLDPWLDEIDLMPGQIWKQEIPKAIRQAGVLLACLSSRSVGKVGYVQNEFRLALSNFGERPAGSIFLIPVRLDDCDVPDLQIPDRGLSLRDIQWVDLWQEGGFDRLGRAIEHALAEVTDPRPASEKAENAIPVAEPRDDETHGGMAPENAQEQVFIAEPSRQKAAAESAHERAPKRKAWVWWRHPGIMAAIIVAVGAVAAVLSPWLIEAISDGSSRSRQGAEATSPEAAPKSVSTSPEAAPKSVPTSPDAASKSVPTSPEAAPKPVPMATLVKPKEPEARIPPVPPPPAPRDAAALQQAAEPASPVQAAVGAAAQQAAEQASPGQPAVGIYEEMRRERRVALVIGNAAYGPPSARSPTRPRMPPMLPKRSGRPTSRSR